MIAYLLTRSMLMYTGGADDMSTVIMSYIRRDTKWTQGGVAREEEQGLVFHMLPDMESYEEILHSHGRVVVSSPVRKYSDVHIS